MLSLRQAISRVMRYFSKEARARRRVKIISKDNLYFAADNELEWYIPDHDPGLFLWVKLFQSKTLRFEQLNLIKPGDTVIDVGACSGEWTIYASRMAGLTGHVIAFEPDLEHFSCLEANMLHHKCKNVECVQIALSDKKGVAALYRIDGTLAGGSLDKGYHDQYVNRITDSPSVPTCTLDAWFCSQSLPEISVMSVTVNEFEPEVLCGAQETLKHTKYVITQSPRHSEVKEIMSAMGFAAEQEIYAGPPGEDKEYIALFSRT